MASKKMDLNKRALFVLSGVSNQLGKTLAIEICRRFKPGSVALLIDECEEQLQEIKKELQYNENQIDVIIGAVGDWQQANATLFRKFLDAAIEMNSNSTKRFEMAFMLHNEGVAATEILMEPQSAPAWQAYIQKHLYAPVALNQEFLRQFETASIFADGGSNIEKLVVNVTSSLLVQPFVYSSLMCSCKKARDMYFRAMAAEENRNHVSVLNYAPGIMDTHIPQYDLNNNTIDLLSLDVDEKMLEIPRVKPMHSTLKLINILEEISFISGHDVDYYDTYFL